VKRIHEPLAKIIVLNGEHDPTKLKPKDWCCSACSCASWCLSRSVPTTAWRLTGQADGVADFGYRIWGTPITVARRANWLYADMIEALIAIENGSSDQRSRELYVLMLELVPSLAKQERATVPLGSTLIAPYRMPDFTLLTRMLPDLGNEDLRLVLVGGLIIHDFGPSVATGIDWPKLKLLLARTWASCAAKFTQDEVSRLIERRICNTG
jgi:hypothetical protein